MTKLYQGVCENRQDPLKLGRCQVRVMGLHTHDKLVLKTEDLPWAYPMQPITSAAMSGIGHAPVGPVEGTWVVVMFRDDDEQYPVILGTLGGIPQAFGAVDNDITGISIKDANGNTPAATDVVSNDTGEPVDTQPTTPTETAAVTTDIPTDPPPSYKGDRAKAKNGIVALLAACDKLGMTTREQKCSVLAIAGGECGWIPQEEGYSYSASGLQSTFKRTFVTNHPDKVDAYTRAPSKGMSRTDFFNFVYAPENNGSQFGNTSAGDGGKYYGRGFIQLTGRANYTKYGQKAGVDLINNPAALNELSSGALVACAYIKDRTKAAPSANPDYFFAAKRGVGNDVGNGAATRISYYEYFYGSKIPSSYTDDKSAGSVGAPSDTTTTGSASSGSVGQLGFKDPNNKYPLKNFINEPDTNRLARGIKQGTVINNKEETRAVGISKAMNQGTFDEPLSAYAAKYPYNHVFESESGHVQEFDDTPGFERIHTYHRKGTFTEVDPNGTEVTHIVGDSYKIIDRNGCIFIAGECNLTVNGNINIFCQSEANIEVTGDTNIQVGNDANIGVAKNTNMVVGGNMKLQVGQELDIKAANINIEAVSNFNILSGVNLNESAANLNMSASMYRETVGTSHYRWNGTKYMWTGADTHERHAGGTDYSNSSDPSRNGSNGASMANSAAGAAHAITDLTAPSEGVPLNPMMDYLVAPSSEGEDVYNFESEDDWNTPAGKAAKAALDKKYGVQTPENNPAQDEAKATGGINIAVVASCQVIYNTQEFTNDFKLSPHFTLGMLIDGGVNGHNKLKDQCGLTKQQIVCNLAQLCTNILEPSLALLPGGIDGYNKQWTINSGFRSVANAVNSPTSDHPYGRACDISLLPKDSTRNQKHFDFIQQLEKILPYDQMILEYRSGGSCWMHVGFRGINKGDTSGPGASNRKMAFTMLNDQVYKRDSSGNPAGFILL